MNHRSTLILAALSLSLLLGGCKHLTGGGCNKPDGYAGAEDLPPLRIPTGLDGPDTRGALRIPELSEPEAPRDPKGPCLEDPPPIAKPAAAPASR
jgi:uncharacterized lipoprotein